MIEVRRYFPTFDFIVRTRLSREAAVSRLETALKEATANSWPFPKPQLSGEVDGQLFRCRPRSSVFGGNAVPNVSGEIISRPDGGTDILVRVIEIFVFLIAAPFIAFAVFFAVNAETPAVLWKSIGMIAWIVVVMTALYAAEAAFVRTIFARLFDA